MTTPRIIAGLDFAVPDASDESRGLRCHAGHPVHQTRDVLVDVRGQGVVHEYPAIPDHLARTLRLLCYDYHRYVGAGCYCTGQDESSHAFLQGQIWEGYETLLAMEILYRGDRGDVVLDFGAHLGWYAVIAASFGYQVVAFEADGENAERCAQNARLNSVGNLVHVVHTWIGPDSPQLPADRGRVRLLKSDLEGLEVEVTQSCLNLFSARRIDYALLEISPVLMNRSPSWAVRHGDYAGLCGWINECGYEVFDVPSKAASPQLKAAFERDPLAAIRSCRVPWQQLRSYVGDLRQTNFLFVRQELA